MSDDPRHDGDPRPLEDELRALFGPAQAPPEFRARLKAELLRDERVIYLGGAGPSRRDRIERAVRAPIALVVAHPRAAALVSGLLAAAAALLLAVAINGFDKFAGTLHAPPPLATATPTATTIVPAPTPRPHTAPIVIAPRPSATPAHATTPPTPPAPPTATVRPVLPTSTPAPKPPLDARHPTATPRRTLATVPPLPTPTPPPATATPPLPPVASSATATVAPSPTATPDVVPSPARTVAASATPVSAPRPTPPPLPTATPASPTATPVPLAPLVLPRLPTPSPTRLVPARPSPTPGATGRHGGTQHHNGANGVIGAKQRQATPVRPTATATATAFPTATATATTTPTATATPRPTPTATATPRPTPTATATPRPSATPTPTATPTVTPTPTMTATPTATPRVPIIIPAGREAPPPPDETNGALNSPLQGAQMAADQPISFSIAEIAGQPAITITIPTTLALRLAALPSTLPVYALVHSPMTGADRASAIQAIARRLGADKVVIASAQAKPGAADATVRLDGRDYALTLYDGYGAPWYDLRALRPGAGTLSATRTVERAASWLQEHHAGHAGLHVLSVRDGSIDYGQDAAGAPLLGPVALHLSFDGSGALHELRDAYVPLNLSESAPALSVNDVNSLDGAITQGQGLYQGPQPRVVTGPAAIQTATLVYVGVHGLHSDFLEPVYAVGGIAPTTSGPRPFTIYAIALQYGMPATPTPTPTEAPPITETPTITVTAPVTATPTIAATAPVTP